jgi:hypothetical protein
LDQPWWQNNIFYRHCKQYPCCFLYVRRINDWPSDLPNLHSYELICEFILFLWNCVMNVGKVLLCNKVWSSILNFIYFTKHFAMESFAILSQIVYNYFMPYMGSSQNCCSEVVAGNLSKAFYTTEGQRFRLFPKIRHEITVFITNLLYKLIQQKHISKIFPVCIKKICKRKDILFT